MGKNFGQRMTILALVFGVIQCQTGSVHAQRLAPADSAFKINSGIKTGLINGSDPANYKLNLSSGLSIRPGGGVNFLSAWNSLGTAGNSSLDPTAFRRGNLIPRDILFDAQHFTFGASYNYGLNNLWRSGSYGGASKSPGLSLHAGFSF